MLVLNRLVSQEVVRVSGLRNVVDLGLQASKGLDLLLRESVRVLFLIHLRISDFTRRLLPHLLILRRHKDHLLRLGKHQWHLNVICGLPALHARCFIGIFVLLSLASLTDACFFLFFVDLTFFRVFHLFVISLDLLSWCFLRLGEGKEVRLRREFPQFIYELLEDSWIRSSCMDL